MGLTCCSSDFMASVSHWSSSDSSLAASTAFSAACASSCDACRSMHTAEAAAWTRRSRDADLCIRIA